MDSSDVMELTLETLRMEQFGLKEAAHPHIVTAYKASISDLVSRIDQIRHSRRLPDKAQITA